MLRDLGVMRPVDSYVALIDEGKKQVCICEGSILGFIFLLMSKLGEY